MHTFRERILQGEFEVTGHWDGLKSEVTDMLLAITQDDGLKLVDGPA